MGRGGGGWRGGRGVTYQLSSPDNGGGGLVRWRGLI